MVALATIFALRPTRRHSDALAAPGTTADAPGARASLSTLWTALRARRVHSGGSTGPAGGGKVSIIVVTYNNPEYTQLALDSILQKTMYPDYEVIVVDNGSAPAMRVWLQQYAAEHPCVQVILNERNLGFPAANNIGIRAVAADSAYIVLLNNDCIVTPGWLTGLVRHLQDRSVGMVGPVTNFAGNEACLNVDYTQLDDIDRFARLHTRTHHRTFDIPMLAMFCVALRRSTVDEVGPLDEQFGAGMLEDDDYALRVRQHGYRVICVEDVFVHHFGRASFSQLDHDDLLRLFRANRDRFERKWGTIWTPPKPRPGVAAVPWDEHLERFAREHARAPTPSISSSTMSERRGITRMVGLAVAVMCLPYHVVHTVYHGVIPYDHRLIFWSWRRRQFFTLLQLFQFRNVPLVHACRMELKDILAHHPEAKGVVVFPPSVPWYTELFQRPHQMALALAAQGYVVLYWVEDMQGDHTMRFRQITDRLYLCNVPAVALRMLHRPIAITYTYNYKWAALLRSPVIVYEMIDHLDIFSNFPRAMLQRSHRRLLKRAAVVVGTADDLLAELKVRRPDAILCPNGVDLAHFAPDASRDAYREEAVPVEVVPADIQPLVKRGKPIIGYYGALAEWFDFAIVKHAAESLPEYQFVLIGPDYDGLTMEKAGIQTHPNIYWLGPKKYAELPRYLACFDVATIPFRMGEAVQAVSPIKLFEYMAAARPIVTTDLVECRKYPVVLIARTQQEWVKCLREAVRLRHDNAYRERLQKTAEANTWKARAQAEMQALEAHLIRHGLAQRGGEAHRTFAGG